MKMGGLNVVLGLLLVVPLAQAGFRSVTVYHFKKAKDTVPPTLSSWQRDGPPCLEWPKRCTFRLPQIAT